jgi:hypothetical protein
MDAPNLDEDALKFIHSKIRAVNRHLCSDETKIDFSKINDVDLRDGSTPLLKQLISFWPPCSGDPRVIEYLMSKGARADIKDAKGNSSIMYAINGGNFDAIPVLQKLNAQIPVWDKSPENVPPLISCIVKLYERLDAEHQLCHTYEKRIRDVYAAATNVVPDLISAGNEPDQKDSTGKTALMLAAENAFDGIVKQLLDAKADRTVLHEGKRAIDFVPELPSFCYVSDPDKCREYLLKP